MRVSTLLCLASLATVSAGPVSWLSEPLEYGSSCSLSCHSDSSMKFRYKPDTTYIYDYTVKTPFPLEDVDALTITARAEIQVIDSCEFALRLQDIRMVQMDASRREKRYPNRLSELQQVLGKNTLRFSFEDGTIEYVCPEEGETKWTLNFKRGLLTAFQISMDKLEKDQSINEVDVTGDCEAVYNSSKTWGWRHDISIQKSKDLTACSQRDSYNTVIQAVQYKVPSEIQSNPILKSSQTCEYTVDSSARVLKSTKCQETHLFNPFSKYQGGKIDLVQELTMKGSRQGVDSGQGRIRDRRSLAFENPKDPKGYENKRETAEQKIKEICQQTRDDVRPETPRLFSELVDIVKVLDVVDLKHLDKLLKDKSICPNNEKTIKFFRDALPMAGTTGAVQLMSSLIREGEVSGLLADAWLSSMALIKDPSRVMIQEAVNLVQSSLKEKALLPVTAMAHTYIKNNPGAVDDDEVTRLADALKSLIPGSCYVQGKSIAEVLRLLKAIGNMGSSKSLSESLDLCLTSTYAPIQVQIAAAEAYRRMPCSSGENKLWAVLSNVDQDSELRIASYVAIMRCPDDETLEKVSSLLEKEEDEQVGAYIYSHLKNIRESSDPLKQDVAERVSRLSLKTFEINALKHSRNHEASLLLNKLNVGFTADSDIIISQKSPLPRSARANLTVDLFGRSINVLEIGGRAEGLEYLLERLLGPYGYFPSSKDSSKVYQMLNEVKTTAYARIFGNDVAFDHLEGLDEFPKTIKFPKLLDLLQERKSVSWTHSQQMMDISLVMPTIAGLPMELKVNGSVNFNLQADGKVDVSKISASPRSLDIVGFLKPSAAMEVTGSFVIDAGITKTGLRMRNTIHSSTGINGRIELSRGNNLNIEIDPPKDNMEVFNANSEFFVLNDEAEEKVQVADRGVHQKDYTYCSDETTSHVLGVKLCGQLQFPVASRDPAAPYYPMAGPTKFSVVSYRTDSHSSYKLFAKTVQTKDRTMAQFLMATPGSRVNRMISTDLSIIHSPEKQLDFSFVSPWKKLSINSALVVNKEILSASSSILVDDNDKYGVTTELKMSKVKNQKTYVPFVEVTMKGRATTLLSGRVDVAMPQNVDMDLRVQGLSSDAVDLKAVYLNKKQQKRFTLSVDQEGRNKYIVAAGSSVTKSGRNFHIEPELTVKTPDTTLISVTGSGDYKPERIVNGDITVDIYKLKPASIQLMARKSGKGKQSKYDMDLKLKSSLVSGSVDSAHFIRRGSMASKVKLNYNIPKVGKDVLSWNSKINDKSNKALTKYIISGNFDSRRNPQLKTGIDFDLEHKKRLSSAGVEIRYGPKPNDKKKVINLSTALSRNIKDISNADIGLNVKASVPEKDVDFDISMNHNHSPKRLNSDLKMRLLPLLKDKVDFNMNIANKGSNMMRCTGDVSFNALGRSMSLNGDLIQKSAKQFVHSMDIICSKTGKHSINTVYRNPGQDKHEIISSINIDGADPIKFQADTTLNPLNFGASGKISSGKDIYSASTESKIVKNRAGKWSLELVHPDRRVEASVEGKFMKDKYDGNLILDWDADKKNSKSQLGVDGSWRQIDDKDTNLVKGDFNIKTPFKSFGGFGLNVDLSKDSSKYSGTGKLSWDRKKFTSTVTAGRPLSLQNAQIWVSTKTPFKNMKEIEVELDHKLNPHLETSLKSRVDNENADLLLKGENNGNFYQPDLSGSLSLKSTFKPLKDVSVSLSHEGSQKHIKNFGSVDHNGRKYQADLQMYFSRPRNQVSNNGEITLTWPEDGLLAQWNHRVIDGKQLTTSVDITAKKYNHKYGIKVVGTAEDSTDSRKINGNIDLTSPQNGHVIITLDHLHQPNRLNHQVSIIHDREEKAIAKLILGRGYQSANAEFQLKGPGREYLHGQGEVNYARHPMTASSFFEWMPRSRVSFDGSFNAPSLDNIDLNSKVTTPFKKFENIILEASHRREGKEYVSHANINYGVRRNVDFENRFRLDEDTQMFRTTLKSPFKQFRSLNTGMRLQKEANKFEVDADFEIRPLVKKHDGFIILETSNGDFEGKLNINTPYDTLESIQINSNCKVKGTSGRTSLMEIEIKPQGVYSFDTSYNSVAPYHFDVTVNTPIPEVRDLGASIMLDTQPQNTHAQMKLKYQPNKEIDTEFKLSTEGNVDGSLRVKTPFEDYEDNNILVRHDPSRRGFTSHGEARLGKETAQADISYNTGRVTSGHFTASNSFFKGFESVGGDFKVRGNVFNMNGDASLNIGSDTAKATFSNIIRDDSVKSKFELSTPVTKDFKISIAHTDSSARKVVSFVSSFDASYGDESSDGKLSLTVDGTKHDSLDLTLRLPYEPLKTLRVNLDHEINDDKISGKYSIKSRAKAIGNVDFSYSKSGSLDDMVVKVNMDKGSESLIDLEIQTQKPNDEVHGKIVSRGKLLPMLMAEMDHKGVISNFNTKTQLKGNQGVVFYNEFSFVADDSRVNVDGKVSYNLMNQVRTHTIGITKEGSFDNFKIVVSKTTDGKEVKGRLEFENQEKIKALAEIENLLPQHDFIAAEFEHSGDAGKFLTTAKINLNRDDVINGRVNFYMYEMKRIEASAELSTPLKGYRQSKLEYRYENNNDRHTSFVEGNLGDNLPIFADLTVQTRPDYTAKLIVKPPYQNSEKITLSCQYNDEKANAEVDIGRGKLYKVSMLREISRFPNEPQVEIITPFKAMKKLTAYVRGDASAGGPFDCDLEVLSLGQTLSGKGQIDIQSSSKIRFSAEVTSDVQNMEQGKIVLNLDSEKENEVSGNVEIQYNKKQELYLNGRVSSKTLSWNNQRDIQVEADGKIPKAGINSFSTSLDHSHDSEDINSKIELAVNSDKILDGDLTLTTKNKRELTINIRQPRPMEFMVNRRTDQYSQDSEVFVNWDRDEPSSNIRVETSAKNKPGYYNNQQSASILVTRSSRTLGAEYSATTSQNKASITGKVMWDKHREGQASYTLELNDNSRKGDKSYDGVLKVSIPTRTVGVSGSVSSSGVSKHADAIFNWDMEGDESKQIGIKGAVSGNRKQYTKADFLLSLPADVKVATEMTLNKGETIFDGKTDISYSRDSRKKLTVYSKVKNNPLPSSSYFSSSKGYNYSMEVGVSHPDTRVDIQLDSHLARSQGSMTSSVGVRYMTDRRVVKNMALFAEIDSLKREISVVAAGPSKNHAISGKIVSEEPLSVAMSYSEDGEEQAKSALAVKSDDKGFTFEIGEPDNLVTLKAFYPNNSALVVELNKNDDLPYFRRRRYSDESEAALHMTLVTPRLLRSRITWKPDILEDIKESVIDQAEELRVTSRDAILDFNRNVHTEVVAKYDTITSAIVMDSEDFVELFKNELQAVASSLDESMESLEQMINSNEFNLKDIANVYEEYTPGMLTISGLRSLRDAVKTYSRQMQQVITEKLEALRNYPISDVYSQTVTQKVGQLVRAIDDALISLTKFLKEQDFNLATKLQAAADKLRESGKLPDLKTIKEKVRQLRDIDVDSVADKLNNVLERGIEHVKNMDMQHLSQIRQSVRDGRISQWIPDSVKDAASQASGVLSDAAKKVSSYWELSQSTREVIRSYLQTLKEIIEVELKELEDSAGNLAHNPVKVYDPEQGLIVIEVPLPKYVSSLYDQVSSQSIMPSFSFMKGSARQEPIQVFTDEESEYLFGKPGAWSD